MLKQARFNKKTAILGRFFRIALAVPTGIETAVRNFFGILVISSILSPFWAVFVTGRKNMMNVMRYLLRFITVFKATYSGHQLFRIKLKLDWRYSFPRSKKANG